MLQLDWQRQAKEGAGILIAVQRVHELCFGNTPVVVLVNLIEERHVLARRMVLLSSARSKPPVCNLLPRAVCASPSLPRMRPPGCIGNHHLEGAQKWAVGDLARPNRLRLVENLWQLKDPQERKRKAEERRVGVRDT